jgi:dUTP diphosphatase
MLNKSEMKMAINEHKLIEDFVDIEKQLTPNGFDITIESIYRFESVGLLDFSNKQRQLPKVKKIETRKKNKEDKHGWWVLPRGSYKVKTNEKVNLPNSLTALGFSRTSLLRMGAFTQNGVWDAGFKGKGEFILVVENPFGIEIKQNARVVQLVFFRVEETESYSGIYKNIE